MGFADPSFPDSGSVVPHPSQMSEGGAGWGWGEVGSPTISRLGVGLRDGEGRQGLPIFITATLYILCKGVPKKHH